MKRGKGQIILWSGVTVIGMTFAAQHIKPLQKVWPIK